MKIRAKEVRAKVRLLTDPHPSFMALVDNGANQTPFAVVKHGSIKRPSKEAGNMAVKGKGSKAPNSRLTKMQFSKDRFSTKKKVRDFLEENEIEGAGDIEDGDDVWIVKSSEDFSEVTLGKARSTATKAAGVTAFIAPVLKGGDADEDEEGDEVEAEGDDDAEGEEVEKGGDADEDEGEEGEGEEGEDDDAPAKPKRKAASKVTHLDGQKTHVRRAPAPKAKKSATIEPILRDQGGEIAQKYDFWGAYTSDEDSLFGVLADGMHYDNVPPGMEEVMMAAFVAMGNIFSDDSTPEEKRAALQQMGGELAEIGMGLYNLFTEATEDATKAVSRKTRNAATAFKDAFSESVDRATDEDFSGFVNVINGDEDEDEAPAKKGKEQAKPARKAAADDEPAWAKKLGTRLTAIEKRTEGVAEELARSPVKRSMSDSLTEILPDEDEDEDDGDNKVLLEDVRRSLGLRPAPVAVPAS